MHNPLKRVRRGLMRRWVHARSNERILRLGEQVARAALPDAGARPVVFFNASTRLLGLSLNAAFSRRLPGQSGWQACRWSISSARAG